MRAGDCYNEPWYLDVVCPTYKVYNDGEDYFTYHINERGEAASPYGYPGIGGRPSRIRAFLQMPLFVRSSAAEAVALDPDRSWPTQFRITCVCPTKDPWPDGCAFLKEASRAERLGIKAEVQGSTPEALAAFKSGYLKSMEAKHAPAKYHALVDRIERWAGNDRICVVSTEHSGALFLLGLDGWAHYHLAFRGADAHGTESYAIFAAGIPWLEARGIDLVHLGGGMTSDPNDSLLAFKAKVGRIPHVVYFMEVP